MMPNIKPVSDLRNYNEVLRDIAVGEPVFLTKNGRGRYAIVDMEEFEKTQATLKLMSELAKAQGIDEHLKATDQMRWVQMMNNVCSSAEETVMRELILA